MRICRILDAGDPGIVALVATSDAYLDALYSPESNHAESLTALIAEDSAFFAGYVDDTAVACGAVRIASDDVRYGEIKRVFVDNDYRGKRLAVRTMAHLEGYLRDARVTLARLEAGPLQPAALKLYERLGHRECGPFGRYSKDPLSVFMEKRLDAHCQFTERR